MCGIVAVYAYHPDAPPPDPAEVETIRERMRARGPDGFGSWSDAHERVRLAHRRLSIIDPLPRAAQPMIDPDGSCAIVFNGEIYNFRQLREALAARGVRFRTESDTEVLLALYRERGEAMLELLRGMFAFAVWDGERRELFLARDAHGVKPLYYRDDGRTVRVASQVKALAPRGVPDPAAVAGFYVFGHVPEPLTIRAGVRALPAGTWMRIGADGVGTPMRWCGISAELAAGATARAADRETDDHGASTAAARAALLDSVRQHLVADVPVGMFLSAGIDSGALLGLARDAGADDPLCITLKFDEFERGGDDEAPLAARVAARYGARHVVRRVTRGEFLDDLPRIIEAMDQPSIDGVNVWFAAKAARENGLKVALSGIGGDELFGGYPSFRDVPRWMRAARIVAAVPGAGAAIRAGYGWLRRLAPRLPPKLGGLPEFALTHAGAYLLRRAVFLPAEVGMLMGPEPAGEALADLDPLGLVDAVLDPDPGTDFARVAALETSLYMRNQLLRDADWAGMAHSVEVRVPLVDLCLLRALAPHVARGDAWRGKRLLAESPSVALPREVVTRAKSGFGIPVDRWSREIAGADVGTANPRLDYAGCPWARRWACRIAGAGDLVAATG